MVNITEDYIGSNANAGVQSELNQDVSRRVIEHRNRFRRLIFNRYVEFLPLLINYTNARTTGIDFLQLETALRQGYQVVVGKARNDEIMVLGYVNNTYYSSSNDFINRFNFAFERRLNEKDINFIVPEYLRPDNMLEIQYYDNCKSGDFVIMRNKPVSLTNDYEVIEHYCDELSEVVLSRFSLIMQSKFAKIFKSEVGDETVNQFITQLYNGSPFIKVSGLFDAEEDIIDLDSDYVTNALSQMKREYQHKISELSNFLGVNSLAVDKESGVSDEEAKSNRGFTTSNSNIYLRGRDPIRMLSKRFNLDIKPYYDDEAVSEISMVDTTINAKGGAGNE